MDLDKLLTIINDPVELENTLDQLADLVPPPKGFDSIFEATAEMNLQQDPQKTSVLDKLAQEQMFAQPPAPAPAPHFAPAASPPGPSRVQVQPVQNPSSQLAQQRLQRDPLTALADRIMKGV